MLPKVFAVSRCYLNESSVIGIVALNTPIESLVKLFTDYYEKKIEHDEETLQSFKDDTEYCEPEIIQQLEAELSEFKMFLQNVKAHCIILYNEKKIEMNWMLSYYLTEHVVN